MQLANNILCLARFAGRLLATSAERIETITFVHVLLKDPIGSLLSKFADCSSENIGKVIA